MSGRTAAKNRGTIEALDAHAELLAKLQIGEGILTWSMLLRASLPKTPDVSKAAGMTMWEFDRLL